MEEATLGTANLEKLKHLVPASSRDLDWGECIGELFASTCKEDLHQATLRLYACLCQLQPLQASAVSSPTSTAIPNALADTDTLVNMVISLVKCLPVVPSELGVGNLSATDYSDCSLLAEAGLASLVLISQLPGAQLLDSSLLFSNQSLLSIMVYTDERDPWTTHKSAEHARSLLSRYLTDERRTDVIVKALLQETIRPLFSRPSALVTASGRPSQFDTRPSKRYHQHHHDEPSWKKNGCFIISTFRFAVQSDDKSGLVANHWPMFLPVIVALAEDEVAFIREQGLLVMELFLEVCPPGLVRSTGIGNVFRDTVFPTLLFLPTLTPEQESISLLRPAYRVLLKLAQLEPDFPNPQKQRLLDQMIRDGIIAAYTHASQHIRVVQVLMDATEAIVKCLGVFAVKHVQNLLRMFSYIMADPFATLYPPAIISAAKALDATLIQCWPRSSENVHVGSAISTIARCWLNTGENHDNEDRDIVSRLSDHDRNEIRQSLVKVSKVLQTMWKQSGCGPPSGLQDLLQREPELTRLFEDET